ncbi:carbamoyltransferase HypF [Methanobrevibacter curvatus]|uniref:Carbamoyltransferase n=1 Tax=Methanobrevibacter curvatus TaxID=49547 RepID=A0A166AJH5_9EURY|nr:carbamoyltransferase HypF [Methanobrevibacter curvatus]KZX12111.1 carbamoyltransferase HypF [Methanobrevibacter curvatus]
METAKILVQGIVQGVGFRPNVYRIAIKHDINGYVRNLGNVVEIIAQSHDYNDIEKFISEIEVKKPPVSIINSIEYSFFESNASFSEFKILESSNSFSGTSVIPPDIAVCENCLKEMRNPKDRRFNHPFIACTDCGPRFTLIDSIPYDRNRTSMDEFPLCNECMEEYTNPLDRRYHAEASCCNTCGPSLQLLNKDGVDISFKHTNLIKKAGELLNESNILAIKGIGGTHLVSKVSDDDTVSILRKRLTRENQAFACMVKDIESALEFCEINSYENEALIAKERPIVVLKKNSNYNLSKEVSPLLHNIGVILPYSPIHHLLFDYINDPALIMTSANIPGEPMMIDNKDIVNNLSKIADYFLLHNRKIINRCDDSVIRFVDDKASFIRRSRGYAPAPYNLNEYDKFKSILHKNHNILALGPELDLTFTILKNKMAYVSQHIGNTNKFKTYEFLQDAIKHLMKITSTNSFDLVACDLHPQFFSTQLAKEISNKFQADLIPVQHHHAHGAVLAVDNNIDELIVIAADGVGYGDDGTAWGGEILYSDIESYERMASLLPQKLPGGDLSTKYPVRVMTSLLYSKFEKNELKDILNKHYIDYFKHGAMEIDLVFKQMESNLNTAITTSAGRVLDSISVALGVCHERTYEGEASMKLESFAYRSNNDKLKIAPEFIEIDGLLRLDTSQILYDTLDLVKRGENKKDIAKAAQDSVAIGLAKMALIAANKKDVNVVGATGGVFYNEAISKKVKETVERDGFKFVSHRNSCAGDGSVSLGQAIVASFKL